LSPGFVRYAWYYFVTANRKSIRFGKESCRQTLDVYCFGPSTGRQPHANASNNVERNEDDDDSESHTTTSPLMPAPVVLFFTGGAWLIGYKMWGALLARALNAAGIIVVVPDMRNYPWAVVPSMVEDVEQSILWTLNNIAEHGGDPNQIVVVGQSAGGHVACTALLQRARRILMEKEGDPEIPPSVESSSDIGGEYEYTEESWRPTDLLGFLSLSSPYNLTAMEQTFIKHGLDAHLVDRIFGGDRNSFDPYYLVMDCQRQGLLLTDHLPHIQIYHGSLDKTVPHEGAEDFCRELQNIVHGSQEITFTLYEGWSHTDPILEGPMDADHRFHRDLFHSVQQWTNASHLTWPENDPVIKKRLCPNLLIHAGRFCNPF
jgi:prenylcysteine alpha-carboxyl methylesterase